MSIFQQLKATVNFTQKSKGVSLMEILVGLTCATLIIGAVWGVYLTSYQSYKRSINKAELNQNARISLERISRDLRQAERVITPLPLNDLDLLNPPSSEVQFQDGHDTSRIQYIKYILDSGNIRRQIIYYCFTCPDPPDPSTWVAWNAQDQFGGGPAEKIYKNDIKADKITSLKFYGGRLVTIDLTASNNGIDYSYKTEVLGRNIQ